MRPDADGAHSGSAAAVGNTKRFVQIEVGHVGAVFAGPRQAHLGVQIRAVQIYLTAKLVDNGADFADFLFKHAVGGRIGHHQSRKVRCVLFGFHFEIGDIDIAPLVAGNHHNFHTGHMRRRRIGAVRRGGNQTHLAMAFTTALVISANGQQAGILTLRAGIGLQKNGVIAGNLAQLLLQIAEHGVIARSLFGWRKGMNSAEFRPGDGNHFRRGVELHSAGAKRNHGTVQREIPVAEFAHIAQHFGLGAIRMKYRMGQERRGAGQALGQRRNIGICVSDRSAEGPPYRFHHRRSRRFIERDAESGCVYDAQIELPGIGALQNLRLAGTYRDGNGIEERSIQDGESEFAQSGSQRGGALPHLARYMREPLGTVVDGVHGRHNGQQDLRRADIGSGFLAPDVLLAGLQRQTKGGLLPGIERDADQTARQ